jgi:hypothetical protein
MQTLIYISYTNMKTTKCWSDGSTYERSSRQQVKEVKKEESKEKEPAHTRACDSFDNQIMSNCETIHSRDTNNRREDTYMKIASREMFNKINQNPFLLGNDYVSDIVNQDQYLKPIKEYSNN